MHDTAPALIWRAAGAPPPGGKTGSRYHFEPAGDAACCATCAAPIAEGVPFEPRKGIAGIDNDTFYGHAEYARYGSHVCPACAWLYGEPKAHHRGVIALGDRLEWPLLGREPDGDRPRWRAMLAAIGRSDPATPLTGVLTTDTKPRLWPRCGVATAGAPALYLHSTDHDWSRWTPFDLLDVARAVALVDRAVAMGAGKRACWSGLGNATKAIDRHGVDAVIALDDALAPMRPSAALLIAVLVA